MWIQTNPTSKLFISFFKNLFNHHFRLKIGKEFAKPLGSSISVLIKRATKLRKEDEIKNFCKLINLMMKNFEKLEKLSAMRLDKFGVEKYWQSIINSLMAINQNSLCLKYIQLLLKKIREKHPNLASKEECKEKLGLEAKNCKDLSAASFITKLQITFSSCSSSKDWEELLGWFSKWRELMNEKDEEDYCKSLFNSILILHKFSSKHASSSLSILHQFLNFFSNLTNSNKDSTLAKIENLFSAILHSILIDLMIDNKEEGIKKMLEIIPNLSKQLKRLNGEKEWIKKEKDLPYFQKLLFCIVKMKNNFKQILNSPLNQSQTSIFTKLLLQISQSISLFSNKSAVPFYFIFLHFYIFKFPKIKRKMK